MEIIGALLIGGIWTAWVYDRVRMGRNVVGIRKPKARVIVRSDAERAFKSYKAEKDGLRKIKKEIDGLR